MDTKITIISGVLALLMVTSGMMLVNNGSNDDPVNSEEDADADKTESQIDDLSPVVLLAQTHVHDWDNTSAHITGFVTDESPASSIVTVLLIDMADSSTLTFNATPDAQGLWTIDSGKVLPGTWVIQASVIDDSNQTSPLKLSSLTVMPPAENNVLVTFYWLQPAEGEDQGTITGTMIHNFPQTCSVEYHPLGQSPARIVAGQSNTTTGTFSMQINTSYHNTEGDIVSECGLFEQSSESIRVNLPVPPVPEGDADSDGVMDEADLCDATPEGEPVYATGCSESETDDDLDGIMNDKDLCPDTPSSQTVDSDGCAESQKDADNDGVNNVLDLCDNTPTGEMVDAEGCADSQKDGDGDGVSDAVDQCPNTPIGAVVGADGCILPNWSPEDSWYCQDGNGPWVRDDNGVGNNYNENTNGVSTPNGGGSGPWFQCEVSVTASSTEMNVNSNGIPNHNWVSAFGPGDVQSHTWSITLNPTNDTNGGHTSTNCPASNGRWECAADRGQVAVAANGVPIFGPEEGPGGDAVALDLFYFNEDRQPIDLGYCGAHAGPTGVHYHWDAMCQYWEADSGQTMQDYDWSLIDPTQHSPVIGWSFDGYPIYGMYTWDENGVVQGMKSSYEVERTSDGGDQGYNGIDDWNYISGSGDLDECNGRFGATPEYPDGTYYYVSTPLSGSSKTVVDTNGDTVPMIGFPYFLLCYHGLADDSNSGGGQGGGGPPGGMGAQTVYAHMPELIKEPRLPTNITGLLFDTSWMLLLIIGAAFSHGQRKNR